MNAREFLLLRTLNSALELALISDELSAEQVNGLAQKLGFESQETLRLVEGLKRQDLVELHWGGKVSITGRGKSTLSPAESASQVYLGKGATYVGPGAQVCAGAAVGQNAMGAGAVKIQDLQLERSVVLADLIAAHQHLVNARATLPPEAREASQRLADETDAIQQQVRSPTSDKQTVEKRLDRAKVILDKLAGITTATTALGPALQLLSRSFDWLKAHLGSIGSWPSITL